MAALRLNASHRDWLNALAREVTSCPADVLSKHGSDATSYSRID